MLLLLLLTHDTPWKLNETYILIHRKHCKSVGIAYLASSHGIQSSYWVDILNMCFGWNSLLSPFRICRSQKWVYWRPQTARIVVTRIYMHCYPIASYNLFSSLYRSCFNFHSTLKCEIDDCRRSLELARFSRHCASTLSSFGLSRQLLPLVSFSILLGSDSLQQDSPSGIEWSRSQSTKTKIGCY